MKALFFFSLLLAPNVVLAQEAPVPTNDSWPSIPTAEPLNEKQRVKGFPYRENVKWLSKTPTWVSPAAKIFLKDKAFEYVGERPDLKGTLALISNVGSQGVSYSTFSFKRISSPLPNGRPYEEIFYTNTSDGCFLPVFSPDGNKLVFRVGYKDSYNNILMWNLKAATWHQIPGGDPRAWRYLHDMIWSPGGRYMAHLTGSSGDGSFFDEQGKAFPEGYMLTVFDTKIGQEKLLTTQVGTEFTWTNRGTILYSHMFGEQGEDVRNLRQRPAVYDMDVARGKSQKLFDGGFYAHESPDGKWIAFADWPGRIVGQEDPTPQQIEENNGIKAGIYFYHRPTKRRMLIGELPLDLFAGRMQWLPNSRSLFVLCLQRNPLNVDEVTNVLYRIDADQQQLKEVARFASFLRFRGTSPDGKWLYTNANEQIDGPKFPNVIYLHTQHTFSAIEAKTGKQFIIARLKNIANENVDWDFHDESAPDPNWRRAKPIEDALPDWVIDETQTR